MDAKTAAFVRDILAKSGNDAERAARWISKVINCPIRDARAIVASAVN